MGRARNLRLTTAAFSLAMAWGAEAAAPPGAAQAPASAQWAWLAGLGAGLAVAGTACGVVWARCRRARRQLAALRAEFRATREALATERANAQALARRLDKAERLASVGTMSAQIAHQLRNPLTSMGLYVQLLGDEVRQLREINGSEAADLLERVLDDLRAMVEITDNYLQYARLPEPELAPLDVNQAVRSLVQFVGHEAERKGVVLSTSLAEDLGAVEADRRLLGFAVLNLLKNGLEAMGRGGRLRVKTCQHNGAVEIRVSDTGPGIPPAEMPRVFEPFYTTKESGTGLGLSLSQQIIERHRGTLTCHSLVGVGTTFTVRLPARAGEGRADDGSHRAGHGAGGRRQPQRA